MVVVSRILKTSGQENSHAGKKYPHAEKTRPEENLILSAAFGYNFWIAASMTPKS